MTHSDKVGDPVSLDEARWVLNVVYDALAGQVSVYTHTHAQALRWVRD
jgi:hypothetical protein